MPRRIGQRLRFIEKPTFGHPDRYERSFLGTELSYKYNVLKISALDDGKLFADPNPFALAVLAARTAFAGREIKDRWGRDKALLAAKQRLMRAMVVRDIPKVKIRALVNFLTYYMKFRLSNLSFIGSREIDKPAQLAGFVLV